MSYVVLKDGATVLHYRGPLYNANGEAIGDDTYSVVHLAGDILGPDELAPSLKRAVADGELNASQLLAHVEEGNEERAAAEARLGILPDPYVPGGAFHQGGAHSVSPERAAELGMLGPEPLHVAPTGVTGAPGVIDPAQAMEASERAAAEAPAEAEAAEAEAAEAEAAEEEAPKEDAKPSKKGNS